MVYLMGVRLIFSVPVRTNPPGLNFGTISFWVKVCLVKILDKGKASEPSAAGRGSISAVYDCGISSEGC